jgi:hypothetical protein
MDATASSAVAERRRTALASSVPSSGFCLRQLNAPKAMTKATTTSLAMSA